MSRKIFLLFVLLLAACKPTLDDREKVNQKNDMATSEIRTDSVSLPLATYKATIKKGEASVSALAVIEGVVALRGGCLVVDSGDVGFFLPVFPDGYAQWEPDSQQLVIGATVYQVGSAILLGGGITNDLEELRKQNAAKIPLCDDIPVFVVTP